MANNANDKSPAKKKYLVKGEDVHPIYQEVEAESPEQAWHIADEQPDFWEHFFEHDRDGIRISHEVQDPKTGEIFRIDGYSACSCCGSEIVETINDSHFRDGECGSCEYERYKSQPRLLKFAGFLRCVCEERLSALQEERDELGPPPPSEEDGWFDDIDDQMGHYGKLLELAKRALSETSESSRTCPKCGEEFTREKVQNLEDDLSNLCDACRKEEMARIRQHFEKHRDECCCHTFLGRASCYAPAHGDLYEAVCIETGGGFMVELRAANQREAEELGQELAEDYGAQCLRVRRIKAGETPPSES